MAPILLPLPIVIDPRMAAPPEAVAAAVVWLVTSPEATELMYQDHDAQRIAVERGLYPDWRKATSTT